MVSRRSDAEFALREEVVRFLHKGLKEGIERNFDTDKEDEGYFKRYNSLHEIGHGAMSSALLEMTIL